MAAHQAPPSLGFSRQWDGHRTPNALGSCFFWLTADKGEIFQYCKGLLVSIKNIHVLVKQSFHSVPLGKKDLKHHTLQLEILSDLKRHRQKNSPSTLWKGLYQVLLTSSCATKLQRKDSWINMIHLMKVPDSYWTCPSSGDLREKFPQNWSRWPGLLEIC